MDLKRNLSQTQSSSNSIISQKAKLHPNNETLNESNKNDNQSEPVNTRQDFNILRKPNDNHLQQQSNFRRQSPGQGTESGDQVGIRNNKDPNEPFRRKDKESNQSNNEESDPTRINAEAQLNSTGERIFIILSYFLVVAFFPLSLLVCLSISSVYQRIVVLRMGRIKGVKGPGLVFYLPCVDTTFLVDLRTQSLDVEPQDVLTKDSVTISVDAVVYYNIFKPLDSVVRVTNVNHATQLLAQTTLRNVLGTRTLGEVLTSKDTISKTLQRMLDEATFPWGVKVERVEIKDLKLPFSMRRAMAAEAEALREAKAKIIAAEGELNSSKALKEASDIMASNPITLQLRYLQTLSDISNEKNSTIVFPFPLEILPTS